MAKKTTNNDKINEALNINNASTISELKKVIKQNISKIIENPKRASTIPPILIHSAPGVGKSSVIKKITEELGIGFVDVRLAEMESVDIRGLPSVENGVMKWNAPDFWPRDPKSKGIIFFDEFTSASKDVQVASYEIVLDRKIGEFYKVPDGWYIVAAGNRTTDRAVASAMSSALANRFLHIELREDSEEWLDWARSNDIHPSVTGFIQYCPDKLFNVKGENLERGWPTPRAWHRVSEMVKDFGDDVETLRKLVVGLVGDRAGYEFMGFFALNRKFDNILDYMYNPNKKIVIPTEPDQLYAMTNAMTYLLWKGKDESDNQKRLEGFFRISLELPHDFASLAMMAAMSGNTEDIAKRRYCSTTLFHHKMYKDWQNKHGKALRAYMTENR